MPTCIFVLARATLRVDGVLFRMHDTRLYHSFASSPPTLVRETSGWEAPYDRVARVRARFFCPLALFDRVRSNCRTAMTARRSRTQTLSRARSRASHASSRRAQAPEPAGTRSARGSRSRYWTRRRLEVV
jgi:hypothetical protein